MKLQFFIFIFIKKKIENYRVADNPQNSQGVAGHPWWESGVACATPNRPGGGRTTPRAPQESTTRRSKGGQPYVAGQPPIGVVGQPLLRWGGVSFLPFFVFFFFFFFEKKIKKKIIIVVFSEKFSLFPME
jgi:hypothetical protein